MGFWIFKKRTVAFKQAFNMGRISQAKPGPDSVQVQCFPLFSILSALNRTQVDYFSLDIEGDELAVLKTIPWDRVDIKVYKSIIYILYWDKHDYQVYYLLLLLDVVGGVHPRPRRKRDPEKVHGTAGIPSRQNDNTLEHVGQRFYFQKDLLILFNL